MPVLRALTRQPLRLIGRLALAAAGAALAMAVHVYLGYGRGDWLAAPRLGTAIAAGLIFGLPAGVTVMVALDMPLRLRGVWPAPRRLAVALLAGTGAGTLAWFAFVYLILWIETPDWRVLLMGGAGLAAGFILAGLVPLPRPLHILLTAAAIFAPIYSAYQNFLATQAGPAPMMALLYYVPSRPWLVLVVGLPFALLIALAGHVIPPLAAAPPDSAGPGHTPPPP
ncbi:MAG: hypothetical protein MUE40_13180 [Anaerolineae bacterium]|nr:hypothetical protein [Anaerolineae bacterium]